VLALFLFLVPLPDSMVRRILNFEYFQNVLNASGLIYVGGDKVSCLLTLTPKAETNRHTQIDEKLSRFLHPAQLPRTV
jgi:hypothetical protein